MVQINLKKEGIGFFFIFSKYPNLCIPNKTILYNAGIFLTIIYTNFTFDLIVLFVTNFVCNTEIKEKLSKFGRQVTERDKSMKQMV